MKKKIKFLFTSAGFKQAGVTVVANLGAMSITALALILVSRYLGPTKFGQFNVAFSLLLILSQIADLGLNFAQNKFVGETTNKKIINQVFSQVVAFKLISTVLLVVLGIIGSKALANYLNFTQPILILVAFVLAGGTIWFEQLSYMLRSLHRFYWAVSLMVLQAVLKFTGLVALVLVKGKNVSLFFSWYALAPGLTLLLWPVALPSWLRLNINNQSVKIRKQLINFTKHLSFNLAAMTFLQNLDVLFVQAYLSSWETGIYSGISRIALLLVFAAYALGMVLNPRVSRYKQKVDLQVYLKKAWLVVLIAVIGFLVFLPLAKILIQLTIGSAYLSGVIYLQFLIAAAFVTFATIPFMALFYSFEAPWYFSLTGIGQILILIVANFLLLPRFGLWAAVMIILAIRVLTFVFTVALSYYYYSKLNIVRQVK
ncbi:MAG: oligosaccharide flippase family protein [Candidatus Pacebacteria bacterium]|nr:oligosaccharide flippase family protein [Candidatus Paceibacterota bacterium]